MLYKNYIKRLLDIILTLLFLPIMIIIFFIIIPFIFMEDKGPVFYISSRLGRNSKIFKMYKFRSMKVNAPDVRNIDGSTFNSADDYRLTKIGKFIRRTSIDELPQLINVLKGDMSLIGPRPDLPGAINDYTGNDIKKIQIRPGITGYNQAYFRNSLPQKEKFKNDVYYVDNLSFGLDIKIFIQTIKSVILKDNIFN